MKQTLYIFFLLSLIASCSSPSKNKQETSFLKENISAETLQTIEVKGEEHNFGQLGKYLKASTYIQLAAEPLVGNIEEIQVKQDKIYLQDHQNRIICYDLQGHLLFKIDAVGNGPGEYAGIRAFAVNEEKRELVIYDNQQLTLLFYNADNGKYLRAEKFSKPNPTAMASLNGYFFYDHHYHYNYPNDSALHYSLLISKNGTDIVQKYFAHNQAEADYHFRATPQPFSYNDSTLYYCRNFDNIVYSLKPDGLKALYEIRSPNPLPFSQIEEKADEWKLIKSDYSFGIESIYQCENLLYFQFTQGGYLQVALYDLDRKEQIYCGRRLADKVGKEVPIHRLINGVYKNRFWGYLTPETIGWALENEPKEYPEIFRHYNPESDNPIVVFYEVVK